jgi:hypothetical protein
LWKLQFRPETAVELLRFSNALDVARDRALRGMHAVEAAILDSSGTVIDGAAGVDLKISRSPEFAPDGC